MNTENKINPLNLGKGNLPSSHLLTKRTAEVMFLCLTKVSRDFVTVLHFDGQGQDPKSVVITLCHCSFILKIKKNMKFLLI